MISKKGQIWMVIGIIVLLISAAVLILLLVRLNLGATTNSEICHNSVVLQSSGTKYFGQHLNCRTDYVCISAGGHCSNMNPTITINVNASNRTQILQAIADQLVSCWDTFGDGQLDYIGASFAGSSECSVCSVIGFDDKVQRTSITYQDCMNYYAGTADAVSICSSQNHFVTSQDCMNYYEGVADATKICSNPAQTTTPSASLPPKAFAYRDLFNFMQETSKTQSQTYLQYLYGFSTIQDLLSQSSQAVSDFYNSQIISTGDQFDVITGMGKGSLFNLYKGPIKFAGILGGNVKIAPVLLTPNDVSKYLSQQVSPTIPPLCGTYVSQAS